MNRTDRTVRQVTIEINSEGVHVLQSSRTFREIDPGDSVTAGMKYRGDCQCRFSGTFDDGRKFNGGGGYLTRGYAAPVTGELLKDGVVKVSRD